jgi:hypothetical protein
VFHGNPSGIDTAAAHAGTFFRFTKADGAKLVASSADLWLAIACVCALVTLTRRTPMALFWLMLLLFFDVVFVTLSLWTFEPLMTD